MGVPTVHEVLPLLELLAEQSTEHAVVLLQPDGRINHPVSCGNMTVYPGDLIVGDADGVVVIEREKAASLLPLAAAKVADERKRIADIQAGKNLRPGWLDGALRAAGLIKEGETL